MCLKAEQKGRSMTEMLGVLMISGILFIGSWQVYNRAMAMYKSNSILDDVNYFVQELVEQRITTQTSSYFLSPTEFNPRMNYVYRATLKPGVIKVIVDEVEKSVCRTVSSKKMPGMIDLYVGDINGTCVDGMNMVTFVFETIPGSYEGRCIDHVGLAGIGDCCIETQYWENNTCMTCPDRYKCNGRQIVGCVDGYQENTWSGKKVCCQKGVEAFHWGACFDCPTYATCDGTDIICDNDRILTSQNAYGQCCLKDSEYYYKGRCQSCPENGTCDGLTVSCHTGWMLGEGMSSQHCCAVESEWMYWDGCKACPTHGICNGVDVTGCEDGYVLNASGTAFTSCCAQNEYFKGDRCYACPAHGRCNGEKDVECEDGYVLNDSAYVHKQCCHATDEYFYIWSGCEPCPAGMTCDGVNKN